MVQRTGAGHYCDHFIRIRLNKNKLEPSFLKYYSDSFDFRDFIKNNMVSSAGQNTVSQGTISNIEINLPPIEEQVEIVNQIETLFAIADRVEAQYNQAKTRIDNLAKSVLAKAFCGKLVYQNPKMSEKVTWNFPFTKIDTPAVHEQFRNGNVLFRGIKIAAGPGISQSVDDSFWIQIDKNIRLEKEMFVSQVIGDSMEPTIPNGSYCLFKKPTGNGQIVLVQVRGAEDPEDGGRYVVKRPDYAKSNANGVWLRSDNPKYKPRKSGKDPHVQPMPIADFVSVIKAQ